VDGLTVHSKPIQTSGIPSNAELNAVLEKDATLFKPLDDEQMTIQNQRKNGTVELKNVRLGDTMLTFERQVNAKRGELEELMQQLKAVDTEIAAAHKAVLDAEQNAVRNAKAVFVAELASLEKEAGAVAGRTRAEVKKSRKEDQTEKAGMDRKLEEFMRELL
jgi:chromosome segregation ATPase